jgi:hypothetical protein
MGMKGGNNTQMTRPSASSNSSSSSSGIASQLKNMMPSKLMKGGSYSSGASYGMYVNGDSNAQFDRTMNSSNSGGNVIIGAQGQNTTPSSQIATSEQISLAQKGGKRKHKKGGFLGHVINNAIVPFGILGLQQTFGRKRSAHKKTHRYRR